MKPLALMLALALAVATDGPLAGQTRVRVAIGFGMPAPYAPGAVAVAPPLPYPGHPAPAVAVDAQPRPYFYRRAWVSPARSSLAVAAAPSGAATRTAILTAAIGTRLTIAERRRGRPAGMRGCDREVRRWRALP